MLQINIPAVEKWDEVKEEFINTKAQTLCLEHSLVSLSKWESKWCKPFLTDEDKTVEETIDYIKCMTITQNVPPEVYENLTQENIKEVSEYIEAKMTATWFSEDGVKKINRETITAELIYYWMVAFNIPFKCEKWHLNRLLTLIRVCSEKNKPEKKLSKQELSRRNAELNAQRLKKMNSKG